MSDPPPPNECEAATGKKVENIEDTCASSTTQPSESVSRPNGTATPPASNVDLSLNSVPAVGLATATTSETDAPLVAAVDACDGGATGASTLTVQTSWGDGPLTPDVSERVAATLSDPTAIDAPRQSEGVEASGSQAAVSTRVPDSEGQTQGLGGDVLQQQSVSTLTTVGSTTTTDWPHVQEEASVVASMARDGTCNDTEGMISEAGDLRYFLSPNTDFQCVGKAVAEFQQAAGENFLQGCKWSPDGRHILTSSSDQRLRVFDLDLSCQDGLPEADMTPLVTMRESSLVYDYAWHPKMDASLPQSCRLASTCANKPVHLWDSRKGQVTSSYKAMDHCDEISTAYSVSFSSSGDRLVAGYQKAIRLFDLEYPGKMCTTIKTVSKGSEGQTGIISCFAQGADAFRVCIAGSYSRQVGVYDTASLKLTCLFQGHQGGVTHLMVSPDGSKLYSGGRKDPEILCWDLRMPGTVLYAFLRDVRTNQRIYFDLSQSGRYLVSGNHDGSVVFWDTLTPADGQADGRVMRPCSSFQAHQDCVNGVSLSQSQGLLATASGQRHFLDFRRYHDSDEGSDSSSMSDDSQEETRDFSLKVWRIPTLDDCIPTSLGLC